MSEQEKRKRVGVLLMAAGGINLLLALGVSTMIPDGATYTGPIIAGIGGLIIFAVGFKYYRNR